jgi:hypothetical protein
MESMGIIADTSELIKKDIPLPLPWGRARVGVKWIKK